MDREDYLKPFVFVLMPFSEKFIDYYKTGIEKACKDAGVYCSRVDEERFDEMILERIYNQIQKADIIVADMSDRNANVYYEVGYAHALNKRVILLTQNVDDIPFDLKHHRFIIYEGKSYLLRDELAKELQWRLREPQEDINPWSSESSGFIVRRITRILAHVSKAAAGKIEMKSLLDDIIDEITEILDADVCSIFLNNSENPCRIRCMAASGFAKTIVGKAEYQEGEGFTGNVFKRGQTAVIRTTEDLKRLFQQDTPWEGKYDEDQWAAYGGLSQFKNGIYTPIMIGDDKIGVIKVENKRTGTFSMQDVRILEAITSGVLAVTIHNARIFEKSCF